MWRREAVQSMKNLATGEIEVRAEELRILSESEVPPFQVEENSKTIERLLPKQRMHAMKQYQEALARGAKPGETE